ncbi:MAG: radical SAM family heme chaperone HemW [Oscillospiraceae bacterium]|jgi:oxygen-independent coproporphyrinogen-3 oxidase|nr:radical SAM family heme chaperone HemW [Oscillospiraceae bacterium]
MTAFGLYIHVPFCARKCPYCDFYSRTAVDSTKDFYVDAMCETMKLAPLNKVYCADTVYLGGGTPSQLGTARLVKLLAAVRERFSVTDGAEITLECNPSDVPALDLPALRRVGYNRVSLGLQSAIDSERAALGRRGSAADVQNALDALRSAAFGNISLDIMLGVPGQTMSGLRQTLKFVTHAGVQHISAYMLKIEPGTPFSKRPPDNLPDDDAQADMYLLACEYLEERGFAQYEISNFAVPGYESRHNLKYWRCEEYLGLGPAAHSFLDGRRYGYPHDLDGFRHCIQRPADDDAGGDFEEYAMLALRLCEGLREEMAQARFGHGIPQKMRRAAEDLARHGLVIVDTGGIRLTRQGFLLSNRVICELL